MKHSIGISDELWDAYNGSASAMRDALWANLYRQQQALTVGEEVPEPDESDAESNGSTQEYPDLGTIITLRFHATCTDPDHEGRRELPEGTMAAYSRAETGFPRYLCEGCYARRRAGRKAGEGNFATAGGTERPSGF